MTDGSDSSGTDADSDGGGSSERQALAALQHLIRASHVTPPDELPSLIHHAAALLGATRCVLYVIDYEQVTLIPLPAPGTEEQAALPVNSTLAGRSFRDITRQFGSVEDGTVWVPVLDGVERLGVIELAFGTPVEGNALLLQTCEDMAGIVAAMLMTHSLYGDTIERARRRAPLTLPAELQWNLLPPLSFISDQVSVAAILAPATSIAGDSFDYAINGDVAQIAIIDAMGHGIEATLLAAVTIGAFRNARRGGLSLAEIVPVVDSHVADTFGPDKFVTGIFGELELTTGVWSWTTCGHPPALLVRGGRVVKRLDAVIGAPLGLRLLAGGPQVVSERLEPADRLLLYTDGVTEARDSSGRFFGTDRLVDYVVRAEAAGMPAAEALRRLNLEILRHQDGVLQDDASTLMVEWRGESAARTFAD